MSATLQVGAYEALWQEVYENVHEEYSWEYETKKEAERWRFRALGYINAVRRTAATSPDEALRYAVQMEGMLKRVHIIKQVGENRWRFTITTRAPVPTPMKREIMLDEVDKNAVKTVISAKDVAEAQAEWVANNPDIPIRRPNADEEARNRSNALITEFLNVGGKK